VFFTENHAATTDDDPSLRGLRFNFNDRHVQFPVRRAAIRVTRRFAFDDLGGHPGWLTMAQCSGYKPRLRSQQGPRTSWAKYCFDDAGDVVWGKGMRGPKPVTKPIFHPFVSCEGSGYRCLRAKDHSGPRAPDDLFGAT